MRRICSMLLVGCGAWAQQPAAKAPQKADAPLTRSLSAVAGTIRRGEFRGTQDGRAPDRFRYSDLKEAVVEPSSYVF